MITKFLAATTALTFGALLTATTVSAADADCLGKSCDDVAAEAPFDIEADNDVATMWELAPGICETARGLDDEGLSGQEISDAAVDIFIEEGLISTPDGAMYLRGLVRGCLAG